MKKCLNRAQLDKAVKSLETGDVTPGASTYAQLLQACAGFKALVLGQKVHAHMSTRRGTKGNVVLQNHVINMYGKCGSLPGALAVFVSLGHLRNLVSWNSLISAYAQHGDRNSALHLFHAMLLEGLVPDKVTYTSVLNACCTVAALHHAKAIHATVASRGLDRDVILSTALVNAYCKCGDLNGAKHVFEAMQQKNVVTWTALIAGYGQHGDVNEALHLFWSMQEPEHDVTPNAVTLVTVVNLCAQYVALAEGKAIHTYYKQQQHPSDFEAGVVPALVNMYGRCGSVDDALSVFSSLQQRPTVMCWNAIISACARNGRAEQALELFQAMQQDDTVKPDSSTYCSVLAACVEAWKLDEGKLVHESIKKCGMEYNPQVATSLISMYGKCGILGEARQIFDAMAERNRVSWNAMLSSYFLNGHLMQVMQLYRCMLLEGMQPNAVTFLPVVNSCTCIMQLRQVHGCVVESSLEWDATVCNALVYMYGRLGSIEDAWDMFNRSCIQNAVTWNGLITAHAQRRADQVQGFQLLRQMHSEGVSPDRVTFISLCGIATNVGGADQLEMVEELMSQIKSVGYDSDPVIGTGLIALLGKCGHLEAAFNVFEQMAIVRSDIVPWNAMISAYLYSGKWKESLQLYRKMQIQGLKPDVTSAVCILSGAADKKDVAGEGIELSLMGTQIGTEIGVRNACINMHGKCGRVDKAAAIFQAMEERTMDLVSWNVMIAAYMEAGRGEDGVVLFRRMQQLGLRPDKVTYVNLLNGCSYKEMLLVGRHIHQHICSAGLESQVVVATALTNMYSKCESMEEAAAIFDGMGERNVVSWNGMIGAYAQQGYALHALRVFSSMQLEGVKPDCVTFINVLDACALLANAQKGDRVHAWLLEAGLNKQKQQNPTCIALDNALVNMHAKCGNVKEARRVFEVIEHKTTVSWSAMVAAYAQVGQVDEALKQFWLMQREGVRPNYITLISILGACSHAGMVQQGCTCYSSMLEDYGVSPAQEHHACIIDMLGRTGWTQQAQELIARTSQQHANKAWMTLLAACSQVGDTEHGGEAACRLLHVDPTHAAAYIALSNTHFAAAVSFQEN